MKKFLAGALAAALVLSVPATATAADTKTVTAHGTAVEYDVTATNPKVVLNIIMPGTLKVGMNPYNKDFALTESQMIRTNNGIVSVAYLVQNLDTTYGVYMDATAVTTTSSSKWSVTTKPVKAGVKGANMSFTASDTAEGIANYSNVKKAAVSETEQGNLPLDSTVAANRTKGTVKGQTSQKKVVYVPASKDGKTPSKIYIGFTGMLADDSATTDVDWTSDDSINVSLVLKLIPGPTTLNAESESEP